jgi:glutamate receptor 3
MTTASQASDPNFDLHRTLCFLQNELDGMTGNIRFDKFGRRSHFKLDVVEYFAGTFQKVGWWETGHGVTRTQSEMEEKEGFQKTLQFKTFIVSSRIVSYVIQNRLHDHL